MEVSIASLRPSMDASPAITYIVSLTPIRRSHTFTG